MLEAAKTVTDPPSPLRLCWSLGQHLPYERFRLCLIDTLLHVILFLPVILLGSGHCLDYIVIGSMR